MTTALERLQGGYYNSEPVSEANPGGFGDGGHVVNFPAALDDLATVAGGIVLDAEAIGLAGEKAAEAASSAEAAEAARDEADLIAAGRTVRQGAGPPAPDLGRNGDWYIDSVARELFGPKAGVWGVGVPMLGEAGAEVELRLDSGWVQWRLTGGDWANLINVGDLDGPAGEEVELRTSATHIQWRRGAGSWNNLIALATFNGAPGSNGQEVSLQVSATHIQWRLGTAAWANLIALADITPAVPAKATSAELRTGANDTKYLTAKSVMDAQLAVALTDASTVAIDLASGLNFTLLTTSGVGTGRTLGAPSNAKVGMTFTVEITSDAASRTVAYNAAFKFPGGTAPGITTTSGRRDRLVCQVNAAGTIDAQLIKDIR